MTPKEKAEQLFSKFYCANQPYTFDLKPAKMCANIAVDELLNDTDATSPFEIKRLQFWQEVKLELEKL